MHAKSLGRFAFLLAVCGIAHGQAPRAGEDGYIAAIMVAMAESCIQVDELLRRTCKRAGVLPQPEKNKNLCELPPDTFEARTARALADFKVTWRDALRANEGETAGMNAKLRATFEQHHGHMRSGSFTMTDLHSLRREADECVNTVEKRMLGPRKPGR